MKKLLLVLPLAFVAQYVDASLLKVDINVYQDTFRVNPCNELEVSSVPKIGNLTKTKSMLHLK